MVSFVFILSVIIWRLTLFLFDGKMFIDNVLYHIVAGLFLSLLICVMIITTIHTERNTNDFSWKRTTRVYFKNLSLGFLCWILSAIISLYVLTLAGQVTIAIQTEPTTLIMRFVLLLVAVFFIEAFPEEIMRDYIYSRLETSFTPWVALLAQTSLFILFAFLTGSLYSIDQWLFIPGFGFLLGYFRMLSGDIWFSMGFHVSMMTITQLISPMRQIVEVDGNFFIVRFLSFVLIPAIISSIILHMRAIQKH